MVWYRFPYNDVIMPVMDSCNEIIGIFPFLDTALKQCPPNTLLQRASSPYIGENIGQTVEHQIVCTKVLLKRPASLWSVLVTSERQIDGSLSSRFYLYSSEEEAVNGLDTQYKYLKKRIHADPSEEATKCSLLAELGTKIEFVDRIILSGLTVRYRERSYCFKIVESYKIHII